MLFDPEDGMTVEQSIEIGWNQMGATVHAYASVEAGRGDGTHPQRNSSRVHGEVRKPT